MTDTVEEYTVALRDAARAFQRLADLIPEIGPDARRSLQGQEEFTAAIATLRQYAVEIDNVTRTIADSLPRRPVAPGGGQ